MLNLLRLARADVDVADPRRILDASFYFFQRHRIVPRLESQRSALQSSLTRARVQLRADGGSDGWPQVQSYQKLLTYQRYLGRVLADAVRWPIVCLPLLQPGRVVAIMTPQRGRRVALRAERQAAQRAALVTQRIQQETLSKAVAAYRQRKETARAAVTDSTLMSIATGREAEGTNAESGDSSSDEESCGVVANGPKPMRIVDGSDGNEADQQVDDSGDDDNDDGDDDDDEDSDKDLFEFDNPVADSGFDESDPVAAEARQVAAKAASERRRCRWAWGVVINVSRRFVTDESLVLDVLLPCRVSKLGSTTVPEPPPLPSLEAKCASFGNKPPTTCV